MTSNSYNINETENQFELTIKRESNFLILFLTGLWTLAWIICIGTIIYGLANNPNRLDGEITFFLVFFIFAELIILKIFLWHFRGKERITLENKKLRIEKIGTILTVSRNYEINYIDSISKTQKSTIPKWMRFWGFAGGKIEFDYLDQKKYFGQTLTANEVTKIIERIKEKINRTKEQN